MAAITVRDGEILVAALGWEELGASAEQAARIAAEGLTVVNAPRPLPCGWEEGGEHVIGVEWQGEFARGIFYVAGRPDAPSPGAYGATLAEAWRALDARPVRLVSNDDVLALMQAEIARRGYDFDEYLEVFDDMGGLAGLADYLGFPWDTGADAGA